MAKKFQIGDIISKTCPFTGGRHIYEVISRTETILNCKFCYEELDGTHYGNETFEIRQNCYGDEYIVTTILDDHEFHYYATTESEV